MTVGGRKILHADSSWRIGPRRSTTSQGMTAGCGLDFLQTDSIGSCTIKTRCSGPGQSDAGLLEFYGMGGMHVRGGLHIGLVRVLRDDLPCDEGGPKDGIGYTTLAT